MSKRGVFDARGGGAGVRDAVVFLLEGGAFRRVSVDWLRGSERHFHLREMRSI